MTSRSAFLLTIEKASPDNFPRFLALAGLAAPFSGDTGIQLHGRWSAESGELNQLYSLWRVGTQSSGEGLTRDAEAQVPWSAPYLEQTSQLVDSRSGTWLEPKRQVRDTGSANLFELRSYDAQPHKLDEFFHRLNASMAVREQYSDNLGLWRVQAPGVSRALHIWGYKDHAHRKEARAQCAVDPRWRAYVDSVRPLLKAQSSVLLVPAPAH